MAKLPYGHEVALGLRDNSVVDRVYGKTTGFDTTPYTIWGSVEAITYPSAAGVVKVSSTDINDDAADPAGAWTVRLTGLDASFEPLTADVTMDGQIEVLTTAVTEEFLRIHTVEVLTAGTSTFNEGTIWVGTGTVVTGVPATKYAQIVAQQNKSTMAVKTIRNGYKGLLHGVTVGVNTAKAGLFELYSRAEGGVWVLERGWLVDAETRSFPFDIPMAFDAHTDLELRANGAAAATNVTAWMDLEEVVWDGA